MKNDCQNSNKEINLTQQQEIQPHLIQNQWKKRVENIIYNIYIAQKIIQSPKTPVIISKGSNETHQEKKQTNKQDVWQEFRKQFNISMAATVNQLYTNQRLIEHVIHFLAGLPFIQNSKKIIKSIVQYYDPSRSFIKSLIQSLVPVLQNQEKSELNRINVILYTLNNLFMQQSPQNSKFNSCIYLHGGDGIKVREKVKWPFEKSGTICLWYNMSKDTKQCKLFEISGEKSGFDIVLKNKKIYFEKIKEQRGFNILRNDSAFLCEAEYNTDVRLQIQFEIKKKIFQKALFISVNMNNFVLNGIQLDIFTPTLSDYTITLFKNFHGKISSALIFTNNFAKEVQNLNSKQGFLYESDIRNFVCMFDSVLKHVFLLYTAIRAKTFTAGEKQHHRLSQQKQEQIKQQNNKQGDQNVRVFNKSLDPMKTILFDAINRRNGIIGPQGSVYRNISIHKKQMALYGGLHTYLGFLNVLKIHSKNAIENINLYTNALGEVIVLFKNIFLSKAASIEQSQGIKLFRILSNFFVETQMIGYTEEITPKLKQLYVALNNRIMKQKFIKKVIWGIPAGQFLQLPQLQNYLNLAKGLYLEQIQNSLNVFNVKDIINFVFDRYDRINCCFQHTRSSSIDYRKKIKKYPQVLAEYFKIIETIVEIKRYDSDIATIAQQIISSFHYNASPCFVQAVVIFLNNLFDKDQGIQNYFKQQFQTINQAKMGLFTTLANTNCMKIKAILIRLILRIFGVKMFIGGKERYLLGLCIRFPINTRVSSIKSQDIDRSVDFSQDKFSFNSTNVRTIMAMRPLSYEECAQLNDQQIVKVIWQWGRNCNFDDSSLADNENPAVLILTDLYKGSTYKIRRMISQIFLSNHDLLSLGPDLMTWVIECLLLCECDASSMVKSDQIIYKTIDETKNNLLKLISIYRINTQDEEQQAVGSQLDIIKLILISVKSKYSSDVSQYQHRIFLLISKQLINSFYLQLKETKFQNEQKYEQKIKHILSNLYKCILEHFIKNGNEDIEQFQDEGSMQKIQQEYPILLNIIQQIFQILLYLASPGNNTLMEQANAKRNQIIFQNLFSEQSHNGQGTFLYDIFACLQLIYDDYDDNQNISQKKLALTLIKKYLIFLIEISQNSGNLKIEKYEEIIKNIFLNALGFLQAKFYHCSSEDPIKISHIKNINELKNLLVNIFLELLQLMKFIEQSSCAKHKSFYQLMKPKKKHKNINIIKNIFPGIWRKVDQKVIQFISLNVQTLKNQQARNKLEEHLKQQRLYREIKQIQKTISKIIDKKTDQQKKAAEQKQKKSVFSYQNNEAQKCKILTEFQESVAMFMFENNNRQSSQSHLRRIELQAIKRSTKSQQRKIWKLNRVYQGFWVSQNFYSYSQNVQTFLYDNTLSNFYKRLRSSRQSKYLLQPFISIQPKQSECLDSKYQDEQIFTNDFVQDQGQKNNQNQRRKSDKYIQVGFQFLKKKVIEKIKKSALLNTQKFDEPSQKKLQVFYFKQILLIQPMKVSVGNIKIDQNIIQFQYRPSSHLQHISLLKNRQKNNDLLTRRWSLNEIETYQLKKFMLKPNSIELYFKEKSSVFLSFYGNSQQSFSKFLDLIQKMKKIDYSIQKIAYPLKLFDPCKFADKFQVTQSWKNRQISNFQYLLSLNILSGRSNNDLNQYFIFPWILADYRSSKFKKDQNKYRDLQKNMGSLGSFQRIQKFIQIKNNIEQNHKQQFTQSHFFGFHYSNLPIVLQYLIRLYPYAEGSIQLQGGKFDIPDRLFISINDTFRNAITQMSDVRELIPQFYYFPQFLMNGQNFDFGIQQNNKRVDNVDLPDGYSNAYDFIQAHREELESQEVSQNLHKWIDLIWGYKQYGKQAQSSYNKFHYLSYETNASVIFQDQKLQNKESIETHISYFGKVPSQIFTKPHPKRNPIPNICLSQYTEGYTRANLFINEKPLPQNVLEQMIRHQTGIFSYQNQACIHFRHSQSNKKYLMLRRDGRGVIFQNQKNDYSKDLPYQRYLSITAPLHFNIFIDKYQFTYIFDESINFQKFPITSLWGEYIFFGGLWGGKIWSYDIITKDQSTHCKHSDTVTAIAADQQLSLVVSGAINGQIIVWQFVSKSNQNPTNLPLTHVPYTHSSRKLIYKNKIVIHYNKINKISINSDLRVAVCSSQDGLVSLVDVERYEVIRVIKIGIPVRNALILNYPYYMIFISCKINKQYCFSVNGQMLDQTNFQNLHEDIRVCVINGYQERVVIKKQEQTYFSVLKLPQMRQENKIEVKKDDNQILQFEVSTNQIDIQILFNTPTHLVHCSNNLVPLNTNKSKPGKKNHHLYSI